jgi:hypothetical protein
VPIQSDDSFDMMNAIRRGVLVTLLRLPAVMRNLSG